MGATIDKTYEAYDPLHIRQQRREERREFRRQLKLERARSRRFYFGYPYDYYGYRW